MFLVIGKLSVGEAFHGGFNSEFHSSTFFTTHNFFTMTGETIYTATTPAVQTEENAKIPQILKKYINETVNVKCKA